MVRGLGSLVAAIVLVTAGAFVSWAPGVDANCDKSYPPCICLGIIGAPCHGTPNIKIAGVAFSARLQAVTGISGGGEAVFEFVWANDNETAPSGVSSVPFFIDLEADATWTGPEDSNYTHSEETVGMVKLHRAFQSNDEDIVVRFILTANPGTPQQESVNGTLAFEVEHAPPDEDVDETTAWDFWPWLLGFLVLGGLVGFFVSRRPRSPM